MPAAEADFAEVWRALDKVVYSRTLDAVSTPRTRLEREFDPEAVRRMKEAADRDISVSGPGLAQHAFRAGLVDEVHLFVFPIVVGGGKPGLPRDVRVDLELARRAAVRQRRGPPAPPHAVTSVSGSGDPTRGSASRQASSSARKASICASSCAHAGSSARRRWLALSRGTTRLPVIRVPSSGLGRRARGDRRGHGG